VGLRVLGPVEIEGSCGPVPVGGPKQRLLLAALLAARGTVVPFDRLLEIVWDDDPPSTARATLQTSLSKLRRLLAGVPGASLDSRPPGYVLDAPDGLVDADRFEAELARARHALAADPGAAVAHVDEALALWNGPAFAEFADLHWALPEATRLEALRLDAVELRNEARLALGDLGAVIAELEGVVTVEPLRERLRCQLMLALHRSGRQGEALRTAAAYRTLLREQLGLDPSPAFENMERAVLDGDDARGRTPARAVAPASAPSHPPATSTPAPRPNGAPTSLLIGREAALDELVAVLGSARLVTLTGPGGVGKSTLANEVARRAAPAHRNGLRTVELAPIGDASGVIAAVAQAVGVERRSERSLADSVLEVLGGMQLLLVIDNCEHVIEAVGELVADILRWCPGVTLLATSREPIGMPGELVRPVAPLTVPASSEAPCDEIARTAAVEVFVARATEAAPGFTIDDANASAVAELCIQLDGLPLALELAAARMSSMTPRQLADRLHERFALLGSGHGRARRHRTLLDVVQWSYGLLDPREQTLLARLSVFAGGFDLDAAERTCAGDGVAVGAVAAVLAGLVDKSLVVATPSGDQFRYSQLETLRQFGAERLAEHPDGPRVHRAHVATFAARATAGAAALDGPDEGTWMGRFAADADNLRAAWSTAVAAGDVDAALELVVSSSEHGFRAISYEVTDRAERVLEHPAAADHALGPTAMAVVGYGAFVRGELDRAVALGHEAVALRERLGVASCGLPERVLGNALFYQGHRDEGRMWMARMVDVARSSGRDGRLAHALYMQSVASTSVGNAHGGRAMAEEAVAVATGTGSPTALAQATYALGLAVATDDPAGALALLEEAARLADSVGNRWMRCFARTEAMWLRAGRGELDIALAGYREVIDTWFRGGDWANQWLSLRHLAGILAAQGRDEAAALLWGAVEAAGAASALPFLPRAVEELDDLSAGLVARMGRDAFDAARRRGVRLRADAAVTLALRAIDVSATPGTRATAAPAV
jgi:predicted ATPase/DNA-binding SARP family transcriptional activator